MKTEKPDYAPDEYHPTANSHGCMHPMSAFSRRFTLFSTNRVVADIGCAYGNVALAAALAGAKQVVACDMEEKHPEAVRQQIKEKNTDCITTQKGQFPEEIHFDDNSLDGIHASHIFEYLSGEEVERGLENCYHWLKPSAKLFLLTYTIYIRELDNDKFRVEYAKRVTEKSKWPGYLEHYDDFCTEDLIQNKTHEKEDIPSAEFPPNMHMFDLNVLCEAAKAAGFAIETAEYINGKEDHAVEETWLDGRELLGIVAQKPGRW